MEKENDHIEEILSYIRTKTQVKPQAGIICGSGLSGLSRCISNPETILYKDIPHFPQSTVQGHAGELVFGKIGELSVVCLKGRFHSYEGHPMKRAAFPAKLFKAIGAEMMLVTGAAGGLNRDFNVGDLMIITDHIGLPLLAGKNPLVGPNDDAFGGPRFPPMSNAYDETLRGLAIHCAKEQGLSFVRDKGTYFFVSGPQYETAAEALMLRNLGGDCCAMSVVPEVSVARHNGLRVLGLALITNKIVFPGDTGPVASHEEVLETVNMRTSEIEAFVTSILTKLGSPEWPELEKRLNAENAGAVFAAKMNGEAVANEIKALDLAQMTPMDAMNTLARLQKTLL